MKKLLSVILSLSMILGATSVGYAQTKVNDYDIDAYVSGIVNGTIEPKNEDPNSGLTIKVFEDEQNKSNYIIKDNLLSNKESKNEFELVDSKVILDVRKIDNSINQNGIAVENYQAIAIVNNTYKSSLTQSSTDELNDVYMYGSINYDKIITDTIDYNNGYKINSVNGKYVRSDDSQMTCKNMELRYKSYGIAYKSSGSKVGFKKNEKSRTINAPEKDGMYSLITGEPYYIEYVPASAVTGRVKYTVKRKVSSYESTGYIVLGWSLAL